MNELLTAELELYGYLPGTEVVTVQIGPEDGQWVIPGDLIGSKLAPFTCGHVICKSYYGRGKYRMDAWKIRLASGAETHIFRSDLGKGVGLRALDACGVTLACPAGHQLCPWCYGIGMILLKPGDERVDDPAAYLDPEWALWCWCDLCMGDGMAPDEQLKRHKISGFQHSPESAGTLEQFRALVRRTRKRTEEADLGGLFS